jgi:hypothetical protein
MDERKKILVGFVGRIYERDWRHLEADIKQKLELVYVKRAPLTARLIIKEEACSGSDNLDYSP